MRERWFIVEGAQRSGPLSFERLLEEVRSAPEPGAALVWSKGFEDWTRADAVARLVDALAAGRRLEAAARQSALAAPGPSVDTRRARRLAAVTAVVVLAAAGAWWLRPRPPAAGPTSPLAGAGRPETAPASITPASPAPVEGIPPSTRPAAAPPSPAPRRAAPTAAPTERLADEEHELPAAELRQLQGVAAWTADTLRLTVYNGTRWRVTELRVRIERFVGDDFVADARALSLLPPKAPVDEGVADLLARVAPTRKKPGLNALDTGVFLGQAGARPEGFRWDIVSAKGYPPLR